MQSEIEQRLTDTYRKIQPVVPNANIDSSEVVKKVEEYRQYWKPKQTNVVLLAESHVYTDEKDSKIKLNKSILRNLLPNYPSNFVRFVYCLGYGETELLSRTRTERKNSGTPQYWKIFSASVAKNESDLGFRKILKTGTQSFSVRLHNKIKVLKKLKKKGVWLLDASIVGLYGTGRKDPEFIETALSICWRNYIKATIQEANPQHIIVIGKGVGNILYYKLHNIGIPFSVIPQPQARGTSEWQLENYKKYQRICAANCK